jgi:RNA polymerase primary sigma factor
VQARDTFVGNNLALVISIVRRFRTRCLDFIDAIQEGNMGLIKAVHRFDYTRGFRFSTYAHWWVRQCIDRAAANTGRHIRVPVRMLAWQRKVMHAQRRFFQKTGRMPSRAEVASILAISADKVSDILSYVGPEPMSLCDSVGSDTGLILDVVRERQPRIDEIFEQRDLRVHLLRIMGELSPLEREIIVRRFGFDGEGEATLRELGIAHDVSVERVRQVQLQTLTKLRRACIRQGIRAV